MATMHSLGIYDRSFGRWLEAHDDTVKRLTGHISESWQSSAPRMARPNVLRIGDRARRTEGDASVVRSSNRGSRAA